MLEEIIDQVSSNEKKDLPKQLPSANNKFVTRQTNFGQIRVELPKKNDERRMIEDLYKKYEPNSEENQKFDQRIWSMVDHDVDHERNEIDFYGLENAHYRNHRFQEDLQSEGKAKEIEENYIDQIAFSPLIERKKSSPKVSIQPETIEELKSEDFNPIDEQYFGTLKQIDTKKDTSAPIVTKRVELPKKDDLNYIDQLVFTAPVDEPSTPPVVESRKKSEKLLDIDFQYPIATARPKSSATSSSSSVVQDETFATFNPKLESMRSIKSKDYFDPPRQTSLDVVEPEIDKAPSSNEVAEKIRESLTEKKLLNRDSLGYRTFEHLVPQWNKLTKAEITDILVKQICFIQDGLLALDKPYGLPTIGGPGVQMSVAHFLPQIIDKLNRSDIRQLHLLHRLDKQSTGVLLMAYTTEAEKRLRELMHERKVIKQYLTIVRGIPSPDEGEINIPIIERDVRGTYKMMLSPEYNDLTKLVLPKKKREQIESSEAITKYRVIESNYGVSFVECQPVTGVKHQIRTHLAHGLGTPILGDHKYSHYAKLAPQKLPFATLKKLGVRQAKVRTIPMCLHSYSMAIPGFLHHQQNIFIRARLSHHMRYFLQCFRFRMIK